MEKINHKEIPWAKGFYKDVVKLRNERRHLCDMPGLPYVECKACDEKIYLNCLEDHSKCPYCGWNGETAIEDFKLVTVSLVPEDKLVDPNCRIFHTQKAEEKDEK